MAMTLDEITNLALDEHENWTHGYTDEAKGASKKARRRHVRRWGRVLRLLGVTGDEIGHPSIDKLKPANFAVVQSWVTNMDDDFRPVLAYIQEQEAKADKFRVDVVDGAVTMRGITVPTNLDFFQSYCDKNDDSILEAMLRRFGAEWEVVEDLSDDDFDILCRGRRQDGAECLASLFGQASHWLRTDQSVLDELAESREIVQEWLEWEEENDRRREEARKDPRVQEFLAKQREGQS